MSEQHVPPGFAAPPPADDLLRAIGASSPVRPRRPLRQLAAFALVAAASCSITVLATGLRPDFAGLSWTYHAAMLLQWAVAFAVVGALALVPRAGSSLVRAGSAGVAALVVAAVGITSGLAWTEAVPGVSFTYEASPAAVARFAPMCITIGVGAALLPLLIAALALRRAVPMGPGWAGAAIGAASGSAGGLSLHLLCGVAEPFHIGLVHGGSVLVTMAIGGLLLRRILRP